MASKIGYTYFIFQKDTNNGIIQNQCKIGSTKHDPYSRAKDLQTGNPNPLTVYKSYHTIYYKEWESYLHFIFKIVNIQGEWFKLSTKQIDQIYDQYRLYIHQVPPIFSKKLMSNRLQEPVVNDHEKIKFENVFEPIKNPFLIDYSDDMRKLYMLTRAFIESDEIIIDKLGVIQKKDFIERLYNYGESRNCKINCSIDEIMTLSINNAIYHINKLFGIDIEYKKMSVNSKKNTVMVLSGIRLKQDDDLPNDFFHDDSVPTEVPTEVFESHEERIREELEKCKSEMYHDEESNEEYRQELIEHLKLCVQGDKEDNVDTKTPDNIS